MTHIGRESIQILDILCTQLYLTEQLRNVKVCRT